MKIIDDEARINVKVDASQPITVNVEDKHKIDVVIGDAAKMDCQKAINYIESGKAEIKSAVETGINDFNSNDLIKTSEFNTNANNKTNAFNSNATLQTTYFNDNATSKTKDFNDNYTVKKALIDAEVGIAKQWAIGDPSEPTGGSSKYWADQASSTVGNCANKDLSNLSATGEEKFVKPSELATVATTGSYNDLLNKPTIPAAQVNSDWNAVSGVAEILNKPTIPTVNDATLTITQGGVSKGTFTANASSDVTIDLDAGGGSSRNVGEIVASSIPLTDAGLHLLDGSLISSGGSYDDFVTYIAGLVSDYPDLFETEVNWQTAVTTYGVCGKFVYDSINGTVRLPKITGMIEGTTDVTALGDLVEAGLPNITGSSGQVDCSSYTYNPDTTGAFYSDNSSKQYFMGRSAESTNTNGIMNFDASRSSSIYGNSQTVQPQTIKVLYYIVLANSVKTQIEVDIDEIATDLNGKADIDLSNCTAPHIVETYHSGSSWYRVYSDGWCEQGGVIASVLSNTYTAATVNLLKPFANTDYTCLITQDDNSQTLGLAEATNGNSVHSKSTSSFVIACYSWTYGRSWYTCGYIS